MNKYDSRGLFVDEKNCISTQTGRLVDPMNLRPEDVDVADIAHSLSRQCRYNGHVGGFLSVARHSLWVSDRLETLCYGPTMSLWGLLHDASETYIGDMVRPMKYRDEMTAFRDAEHRADATIAKAFSLPYPMPEEVHEADHFVTIVIELGERRATWETTPRQDYHAFMVKYMHIQQQLALLRLS